MNGNGNVWVINKLSENGMSSFCVEDEWLDAIPRKGIVRIELCPCGVLEVEYKSGSILYYEDVNGTWGNPVEVA